MVLIFSGFTIITAIIIVVAVALVLCVIGVLTSSIVALRCILKQCLPRKDTEDNKQSPKSNDVVYDELIHVGVNPSQITMEDNTAYGEFSQSMV